MINSKVVHDPGHGPSVVHIMFLMFLVTASVSLSEGKVHVAYRQIFCVKLVHVQNE